jgi:hypothetical protein
VSTDKTKETTVPSAIRILVALALTAAFASPAQAIEFSPWAPATNAELIPGTSEDLNTAAQDGCPIQSPDGLSLFIASNRPAFAGDTTADLDIWVASRPTRDAPWGAPVNLGAPVNSPTSDEFCPTPIRGEGLFFVSRKVVPGVTCGMGDIYFTRENPEHGWDTPEHLDCAADGGPNSALDEQGPSYVRAGAASLYFSSGPDIYVSRKGADGEFGLAHAVTALNSGAMDVQPNVRKDGREVVFASNRPAFAGDTLADLDIWVSTRDEVSDPWSAPVNIGPAVNTTDKSESRPSLSWDGTTLYFGRGPVGGPADVFVTTRERLPG